MRVLLVEDDDEQLSFLLGEIERIGDIETLTAQTKTSAEALINQENFFDLIILDLKIPHSSAEDTPSNEHGIDLYFKVASTYPGTPVIVFSGHATKNDVQMILRRNNQEDVYGTGQDFPMTDVLFKEEAPKVLEKLRQIKKWVASLNSITINSGLCSWVPEYRQARILRLFARRHSGMVIQLKPLGGGLSSSTVLDIKIYNSVGGLEAHVAGKLASIEEIADEIVRYDRHISRLQIGNLVHKLADILCGAGSLGGVFYLLAKEFPQSFFDVLQESDSKASAVVKSLQQIEMPWYEASSVNNVRIKDIMKWFVSDELYKQIRKKADLDFKKIDNISVRIKLGSQHKDAHGLNILVDSSNNPIFIDYGDADNSAVCTDPIILELSTIFHPKARELFGTWASEEVCSVWPDVDKFSSHSPFPQFITCCRRWAFDVSAGVGDCSVYAVAFCYALRQLKYEQEIHPLAIAIAKAASEKLLTTV